MDTSYLIQLMITFAYKYKDIAIRGVVILGGLYLFFWLFKRPWLDKYRVQPPTSGHKARPLKEISYVITTYLVYAFFAVLVGVIYKLTGYIAMYPNISDFGWEYAIGSYFIFFFYTDTTFYWSHILMHKVKILYRSHGHHHQFINVTPFAAYAFQFGEALLSAGSFFVLMMVIPWHPMVLLAYTVSSIFYNGMLHSGYDLFPKSWRTNPVLKWLNTPTHHIYHHQKSDCNYGFVLTFWDKIMKTEKLP